MNELQLHVRAGLIIQTFKKAARYKKIHKAFSIYISFKYRWNYYFMDMCTDGKNLKKGRTLLSKSQDGAYL